MTSKRAIEQLRQERETFDQLKAHNAWWFRLRLVTGFAAIFALLVILVIAASVVLSPSRYSDTAVIIAAAAILADIAGLAGTVFSLVLRDNRGQLHPLIGNGGR